MRKCSAISRRTPGKTLGGINILGDGSFGLINYDQSKTNEQQSTTFDG
jgi:hypothetical protein